MNGKKYLTYWILIMMVMSALPIFEGTEKAEGTTHNIPSEAAKDGVVLTSQNMNYDQTLLGNNGLTAFPAVPVVQAGQEFNIFAGYRIRRGYLSFNTSAILNASSIISAKIGVQIEEMQTPYPQDFDILVNNTDYGALDLNDWNATGNFEGILGNTTGAYLLQIWELDVNPENINRSGSTQYILKSSREGTAPTQAEYIGFWSADWGGVGTLPYIEIVARSPTGATLIYNFTNEGNASTNAMVEYWDEHILASLETGFEDGIFGPAWTTFGSPLVTASFAPYEGVYHAGASISESGAGNHTFEAAIDGTGLTNLTLSYFRKTQDVGGGTVNFIADWWNGTHWNEFENFTGSSLYTESTWMLNSTADNNPNLIFRFNVTITAGNPSNGGWIDNPQLISTSGYHEHANTTIYPTSIFPWNETTEQVRYEVCAMEQHETNLSWIRLNVKENLIFQSYNPTPINLTYLGSGSYNITEIEHLGIFYSFWFLNPIVIIGTNHTIDIEPTEIIEINRTTDLYRYDLWTFNETSINFSINGSYVYDTISPFATVTDYGVTGGLLALNITNTFNDKLYYIWFFVEKPIVYTNLNIALWHSTLGEGILWERFKVVINDGLTYDNTTEVWIPTPQYKVLLNTNYTISIVDFFDNSITSYSFVTISSEMDLLIPVPVHTFKAKNLRRDTTLLRIFFNATGTPFQQQIVSEEIYILPIREGSYMFVFTFLTTADNITFTIGQSFYYNLTVDGDYTAYIGSDLISLTYTNVNGIAIEIDTITTLVTPPVLIIGEVLPTVPVEGGGTRSNPPAGFTILKHPYQLVEASVDNNISNSVTGIFWNPASTTGTITYLEDKITINGPWETNIMLNITGGANFVNLTHPQTIDLLSYANSENFTLWSNQSLNAYRTTRFRQTTIFNWNWFPSRDYYTYATILNNTTPYDWYNTAWFVARYNESEMELVQRPPVVYDQDNDVPLEPGMHYDITVTGFHMLFDVFNSTEARSFTFTYYNKNETNDELAIIGINSYLIAPYRGSNHFWGSSTYLNHNANEFTGQIAIKLNNLVGIIDPNDIWVVDTGQGGDEIGNLDFVFSGNTVTLTSKAVRDVTGTNAGGGVATGDARKYTVYFNYLETEAQELFLFTPWFTIGAFAFSFHTIILMLGAFVATYGFFSKGGENEHKIIFIEFGVAIFLGWVVLYVLFINEVIG